MSSEKTCPKNCREFSRQSLRVNIGSKTPPPKTTTLRSGQKGNYKGKRNQFHAKLGKYYVVHFIMHYRACWFCRFSLLWNFGKQSVYLVSSFGGYEISYVYQNNFSDQFGTWKQLVKNLPCMQNVLRVWDSDTGNYGNWTLHSYSP